MACGLGQGAPVGSGTEPASYVGLGCLEEFFDASRGFWWGTGGQAQVAENLDDDRGIFNGRQDGQRAAEKRGMGLSLPHSTGKMTVQKKVEISDPGSQEKFLLIWGVG